MKRMNTAAFHKTCFIAHFNQWPPVGSREAEYLISKALQAWNDNKHRKMSKAPSSIAARSSASRTHDACCQTDHAEVS